MIKFFKKTSPQKAIVALDIGTENVQAAVFTVEEKTSASGEVLSKRGVIHGIGRVSQRMGDMNVATDIASIVHNCKNAIRKASDRAGLKPQYMVMGIAGEFIKGSTSTLVHKREDQDSKINISELRNIIHKLEWKAFEQARKALSNETGYPEIDLKLMNSVIVDVRIDGYKVKNPLGFQGKEVQMSIFNSFAPITHHGALHEIATELELESLVIASEAYGLSSLIKSDQEDVSIIYIDVGGGSTDIAVVSGSVLAGTKMFGVGGRTFTKRLSIELNINADEAEKLKKAYTADRLEQKSKKIIADVIKSDIDIWTEGIILALSEFKKINVLPSKILLCGGGAHLPEIKNALNSDQWYKKLHFARRPDVRFIQPNELTSCIDETKEVKDFSDVPLMALVNLGLELWGEESVLQKTLKKVIGIMKV